MRAGDFGPDEAEVQWSLVDLEHRPVVLALASWACSGLMDYLGGVPLVDAFADDNHVASLLDEARRWLEPLAAVEAATAEMAGEKESAEAQRRSVAARRLIARIQEAKRSLNVMFPDDE